MKRLNALEKILILDANARLRGKRLTTLDVIGAGSRTVTALLKYYGFEASLQPYENIARCPDILQKYDVLAISFMSSDIVAVRRLIELWKKINGLRGIVVLGGSGTLDINTLKFLDFDIAFIGEAEVILYSLFNMYKYSSFSDLIQDLKSKKLCIRGIAYKIDGNIVDGGLSPWTPRELLFRVMPEIEDIRNYPFYWACRVYVEAIRGCSNFRRPISASHGKICTNCSICSSGSLAHRIYCPIDIPPGCGYCSVPMVHGYARSRDLYSIVEEVQKLLSLGVTRIVLSAPDFLDYGRDLKVGTILTDPCDPQPNIDIIEKLLKKLTSFEAIAEARASISIENIKACLVDEYIAEVLGKYLKGTAIYIGLESCSDELLKKIGRPSTCRDTLKAIELLSKNGLKPYVYLIHGLPHENANDIAKTVNIIQDLENIGVERIVLYRFIPLPKTAFESYIEKNNELEYQRYVKLLKETVREFNEKAKKKLLRKIIDVVIASSYPRKRGYIVAYPLYHGPVVLLRASSKFIGCIARVRITKVLSDRMVLGSLMHIRYRVYETKKQ